MPMRWSSGTRQQFGPVRAPQGVELQRHRRAEPQRVAAVVVDRVVGQRMDQHIQAVAMQHQPLSDGLKLLGREDDLDVGDWMWADRLVAEPAELDLALLAEDSAEPLGSRARPCRI